MAEMIDIAGIFAVHASILRKEGQNSIIRTK
jgi:hypothetical protein